jgi:hypothetical protein
MPESRVSRYVAEKVASQLGVSASITMPTRNVKNETFNDIQTGTNKYENVFLKSH